MITSADIGLADWHTHTHRDGSATLLRQTVTRLALISHRGPGDVRVRLYSDPHGMDLAQARTTEYLDVGRQWADSWLDGMGTGAPDAFPDAGGTLGANWTRRGRG